MDRETQEASNRGGPLHGILRYLGVGGMALVLGGLTLFLVQPLFDEGAAPVSSTQVEESPYLDVYIGRDASGSIDVSSYLAIEREIFDRVRIQDGDRLSYFLFGAETYPEMILPPSKTRMHWKRFAARTFTRS